MTSAFAENATQALSAVGNATQALSVAGNATLGEAAAASIPPPVTFSWLGYFEAIGVMFLLLVALWALLWLARRYGKFRFLPAPGNFPNSGLRIEAQLPLGPRRGLYVIRYLDERLLIGVTEQQITLLQEMAHPDSTSQDYAPFNSKVCPADAERFARHMEEEQQALSESVPVSVKDALQKSDGK